MVEWHCQSASELNDTIDSLPPGLLFRGQTKEYLRADGGPDLRSSIDRHGCVPDRMLKWWQYSRFILGTFVKSFDMASDLATDQAILQHYGWRSFFLDASSSAQVAAWFAGHKYKSKREIELVEDCWEDPVFAIREEAFYEPAGDQVACLYAIGGKGLRRNDIDAVDLVEIATEAGSHRCSAQSAFMVGPLNGNLPDDCIVAKIFAPTSVFREFAAQDSSLTQEGLFPPSSSDPFLAALSSVPWVKRYIDEEKVGIDFFDRGLGLPEYNVRSMKRNGPAVCFYRRFWIADTLPEDSVFSETHFYLSGETLFHGAAGSLSEFPKITELLTDVVSVAVELDGLVAYPYAQGGSFAKGIYLERQEDGSILLTELAVEQHGLRPAGFGITRGVYYMPSEEGDWKQISHPEECDCGHETHHRHHLVVASHFENALASGEFTNVRKRIFASEGVTVTSDPAVIEIMKLEDMVTSEK
ncbi:MULTISPECIES: FRG domain-containing protein [Halocynthiibacter]|uniref:FRG domain-containing protein n=1 Tax=Halocynthiibacter halioticoli TaxID=2986804 RepID=A0AAE3IZW2_9RHOB|nr:MULTISPECIES: FRG domain-containing protein [Halocynthiibacter]MCV6825160.1 FRG domain-containing protein [Halocynthiibacter halioticoli]MCW4058161.1 FRG domain-containing protein [Halocynthiibacter sp. SDUM655004]